MISMTPLPIGDGVAVGITVDLPKTRLVIATAAAGYIMCGALDVALLDEHLASRQIVAGRAVGVRTLEDLLAQPLERVTAAAAALGLRAGMTGREALGLLVRLASAPQGEASPGSA
jgi:uncharacterized protein YunC (DUF1805 family)